MSNKELAKQIIDNLPEYKVDNLLMFLKGMQLADEIEDDQYCEQLVDNYLDDPDPDKHSSISLEELVEREKIIL